jgi:hypothetical protein
MRRGHRGRGAVLARAGLGDDPVFAHIFGKEDLPKGVVEFVCPTVEQVLTLEVYIEIVALGESVRVLERGGSTAEIRQSLAELVHEPILILQHIPLVGIL